MDPDICRGSGEWVPDREVTEYVNDLPRQAICPQCKGEARVNPGGWILTHRPSSGRPSHG